MKGLSVGVFVDPSQKKSFHASVTRRQYCYERNVSYRRLSRSWREEMSRVGERERMGAIEQPAASEAPPVLHRRQGTYVGGSRFRVSAHRRSRPFKRRQAISREGSSSSRSNAKHGAARRQAILSEVLSGEQASDRIVELSGTHRFTFFRFISAVSSNLSKPARKLAPSSNPEGPITVGAPPGSPPDTSYLDDLPSVQSQSSSPHVGRRYRKWLRIKRLHPGSCSALGAALCRKFQTPAQTRTPGASQQRIPENEAQ
ncbi:hypothetical protein Bra471DRAFT_01539 [Bradyrhizobium sp. WSM471]|nr:hypothetical protein Bra471DRAFT_01539 [Bradyrhizobium sp. WSM471]